MLIWHTLIALQLRNNIIFLQSDNTFPTPDANLTKTVRGNSGAESFIEYLYPKTAGKMYLLHDGLFFSIKNFFFLFSTFQQRDNKNQCSFFWGGAQSHFPQTGKKIIFFLFSPRRAGPGRGPRVLAALGGGQARPVAELGPGHGPIVRIILEFETTTSQMFN